MHSTHPLRAMMLLLTLTRTCVFIIERARKARSSEEEEILFQYQKLSFFPEKAERFPLQVERDLRERDRDDDVEFIMPQNPSGQRRRGDKNSVVCAFAKAASETRETKNKTRVLRVRFEEQRNEKEEEEKDARSRATARALWNEIVIFYRSTLFYCSRTTTTTTTTTTTRFEKKIVLLLLYAFFNAKECTRNVFSACRSI